MADFTDDDEALLGELGVEPEVKKRPSHTAREERVIAGFEDIQRFVTEHGHAPNQGEGLDIFERLYAVRLDRLRALPDCRALLLPLDHQNLLTPAEGDDLDDDALLAELGVDPAGPGAVTTLRHVRSVAEKKIAEEIANRQACTDFEQFRPMFEQVQRELTAGLRQTRRFERKSEIEAGRFYILGGQIAYVAAMERPAVNENGDFDARLRVILANGTESNLLMRSLQRGLQQDATGRRILDTAAGPLFADASADGDEASGTVYVLRSRSDHPVVVANRDLVHKIGVTGGDIARRIANARTEPTYLLADVEVVRTYDLYNINRSRLEALIHRVFHRARLEIELKDRFGQAVVPREWFLVPMAAIDDTIERIRAGTITGMAYDPQVAALTQNGG